MKPPESLNIQIYYFKIYFLSFTEKPDIVITMDPKKIVTYEELLEVIKTPSKYLIDVRNPDEIKETGKIPSSINIPLPVLGEVLSPSMSNEDFTQQYQRPKPTSSDELIFTCQSGRRATSALETALKLGYPNSKNYTGSWKEWASRQNL